MFTTTTDWSENSPLDCVAGATGAKYGLGKRVKATAVEEPSGEGIIENVEMSKLGRQPAQAGPAPPPQ